MTPAERLITLAGSPGPAGAALSAFAGAGPAGARLAAFSGLGAAEAWRHLMVDVAADGAAANASLPSRSLRRRRGSAQIIEPARARHRDDILLWIHRWL